MTALLTSLERDFEKAGKRSVKDCLRSKTLPCSEVKTVLQERSFDNQELQFSLSSILTIHLDELRGTTKLSHEDRRSSLYYISKVATVIRFLQLLFEYKPHLSDENNNASDNKSSASTAGDAEVNKMILQTLRSLTGVVCTLIENENDGRDHTGVDGLYSDASQSFNPFQVACFVFGSLVRINYYVRSRPFLLSPLWKGLCDIATNMKEIPQELCNESIRALLDYLKEGTEPMLMTCVDVLHRHRQSQQLQIDTNQQQFQSKILSFLIARITTFLKVPIDAESAGISSYLEVFAIFSMLRGLDESLKSSFLRHSDSSGLPNDAKAFLHSYQQISAKVDRSVGAFVWDDSEDTESLFHRPRLDVLLKANASLWKGNAAMHSVAVPAFAFGKSLLLLKVLEEAWQKEPEQSWSDEEVDAFVRICQTLVFHSLPLCHEMLVLDSSVAQTLLPRTIELVSSTLLRCECCSPCIATNADPGRMRFHRLLIKWLNPSKGKALHALTRELLITIVYLHVVGIADGDSIAGASPILSLLVKLFFDPRTNTGLRNNIGSVLTRLIASSTNAVQERVETIIAEEYSRLERSIEQGCSSRKRKRDRSKGLTNGGIYIICVLVSKLRTPVSARLQLADWVSGSGSVSLVAATLALGTASRSDEQSDNLEAIGHFIKLWNSGGRRRTEKLIGFGIAVLRKAYSFCETVAGPLPEQEAALICQLIESTTSQDLRSGTSQSLCTIAFESVRLLGVVGKVLSPNGPKSVPQLLAQSFHRLLSYESWPVRAFAMSSLVRFASTIPAAHKNVLRKCLPPEMQKLLQCRLQCSVYGSTPDLMYLQIQSSQALVRLVNYPRLDGSVFPATSSVTIPLGSYFMTMPTQEGRKAIVIFPPGQQSLQDINYMRDVDDDGKPELQTLYQAATIDNGGCRLLLRS